MVIRKEYPVSPSLLSTVAQEAFVLECNCPTYILNLLHRRFPTPVMTTRNPGFSDLPREKLYTVKPCCPLRPHDGANLHTINDPPTPPLYFVLYFTCFHLGLFQDPCAFYASLVGEAASAESPLDIGLI